MLSPAIWKIKRRPPSRQLPVIGADYFAELPYFILKFRCPWYIDIADILLLAGLIMPHYEGRGTTTLYPAAALRTDDYDVDMR